MKPATSLEGALPAPPNVIANVRSDYNPLRAAYLTSLIAILVFPLVLVPLRIYTKACIIKAIRLTDVACLVGFLNFIALIALGFVFLNVGMGKDAWNISMETYARLAELLNIQQVIYMPSILFTKIAILLQLIDIFVPPRTARNPRWYSLQALILRNALFFIILMFLEIFQCTPRHKIWNPTIPGHCIDINKTFVATGAINVLDDFIILVIPLVWTWQLQLRTKQKFGVSMIFATGFFACITSVMRLVESIKSLGNPNISRSLVSVSLWAVAEVSSGLIVCCLPVLPRLFNRRGAMTRVAPSEPSGNSLMLSKTKSHTRLVDSQSADLIHSAKSLNLPIHLPAREEQARGGYITKSIKLEQVSASRPDLNNGRRGQSHRDI